MGNKEGRKLARNQRGELISEAGKEAGEAETIHRDMWDQGGEPGYEGVVYQFGGPWYDLDSTPFQQAYKEYAGTWPAMTTLYASDVFLFQQIDGSTVKALTNGETITEILTYCLSVVPSGESAPFQIGTISPAVPLNTYQARDLKCSEAIHHCMRASPDCAVQFDYSTIPPTLNIRKRSSLTAKSVTFADEIKNERIRLTPRYDLQPDGIIVRFKTNSQHDEKTLVATTVQKYPLDCADGGRGTVVMTVDLEGYRLSTLKGSLECVAFTDDRTWWQSHFAELKTTKTRRFRTGGAAGLTYTDEDTGLSVTLAATTIKDKDGNNVSLATYPNVLVDGAAIAPWMVLGDSSPVIGIKATITAEISCKEYDVEASGNAETSTNGRLLSKYLRKQIEAHVTLTNGVTGYYSTVGSLESGEPVPAGMAQAIYVGLALLQYQGTFSVVEAECSTAVRPGDVLNITNGRAEWATMKALVQQVSKDYGLGKTAITIGPAAHLSAGDLTQLFLVNRHRFSWRNPHSQATGLGGGTSANGTLGSKTPGTNTLPGLKEPAKATVSAPENGTNKTLAQLDAEGQAIDLHVQDATGARVSASGHVRLRLADCLGSDSVHHQVELREMCVTVAGVSKTVLVACSEPYDVPGA